MVMEDSEKTTSAEMAKLSLGEAQEPSAAEAMASKENVNIVFVGHVDSGKSTIGGQILVSTGMVDKRTLEKYEKESRELNRESWYLSWALDTNQDERAKGITVECGRGYFETAHRRFTILDAPGHKNYVPSMISGATQADVAILVISARKGEFETGFEKGGQTREHATLVKTLGVRRLIVAINKMDEGTVGWARERYDEIVDKITPFLKANGYNLKAEVTFIPISGFTGLNIKEPVPHKVCPWWDGPALLPFLDTMPAIDRRYDSPLIMPVSDKCKDMGTIVTGKIEAGTVAKGQAVLLMPNRQAAEVLSVFLEDLEVRQARAGDNVRLKLRGVEEEDISTGFVVCDPQHPVRTTTSFVAQIAVQAIRNIMAPGFRAVMHVHSATEDVALARIEAAIDKKSGERAAKKPMFARQGDIIIAELTLDRPVCIEPYAECNQLGRFSLRNEGVTIAVGKILQVL